MGLGGALQATVAIKAIDAAVDEAAAVPWNCVDPDELAEAVARIETAAAKVASLRARVLAETEQSPVAARHGFRATDQYVAARTGGDPADIRAELRIGRWLRLFPQFADAYASGRLSRGHVEWMRRGYNQRVHHHLVDAQQNLIDAAARLDWVDWLTVWGYFLNGADPDGQLPKNQIAKRRCTIRKRADGTVSGTFHVDPISGHAIKTAIDIETQRLLDEDAETDIRRSGTERTADALTRIVMRGAKRDNGTLPAPLVHITVGKELADDMVRAATDPDGDNITLLADRDDIDRWCELADGTPLHPHLAMAVLAVAEFNRLVLDAESEDPGLGRSSIRLCRSNGLGLRQSAARSRSEATDPSPRQVRGQADHVHAWAKHGPTATHNSQPLCRPDNRHKGDN